MCNSFKIKIDNSNFDLTVLHNKLKAVKCLTKNFFYPMIQKNFLFAINEMAYNLNINNTITSCYWFEWILAFETKCKNISFKCICEI